MARLRHCSGSPSDSDLLERYTRAADVAGVDLLVRLPDGDPSLVRKVLDTGVRTLLVPQVERAGDIRPSIEASRFTYDGLPGRGGAASAGTTSGPPRYPTTSTRWTRRSPSAA